MEQNLSTGMVFFFSVRATVDIEQKSEHVVQSARLWIKNSAVGVTSGRRHAVWRAQFDLGHPHFQ